MEKGNNPLLTNEMVTTILKFISNKKFASVSEIASHINLTEKDTTVWLQILLNEGIVYQDEESKYGLVQKPISKPPVLQLGLCGVLLIIISIFAFKEYFSTATTPQELEKDPITRISPYINNYSYTKDDYPELIEHISDNIDKVNERMQELQFYAAKAVIENNKCDYVKSVIYDEIDQGGKGIKFIIRCRDDNQIFIDEETIINGGIIKTALEQGMPEKYAIERCNDLITQKASPNEVDKSSLFSFYHIDKRTGISSVSAFYKVKDRFGLKVPYGAKCFFSRETWNDSILIKVQ